MKRIISITLIVILMATFSGCETLQRKFIRKSKKEPLKPRFYQEGMAETRPHIELYMMHYMYWKTWQEDLIAKAGDNAKRDRFACNEIIGNLTDMKKHLEEEKAKELDSYIEQIKRLTDHIKKGSFTSMRLGFLKQKLDDLKGRIIRKFYYKKVRDYIKPD